MFDRFISIDWSGRDVETRGVELRVTMFDGDNCRIIDRQQGHRQFRSWTRFACREWLKEKLKEDEPTLIACDFGFGYAYGMDQAVFNIIGWREVVRSIGELYSLHGTARATAEAINALPQCGGHGPFRFNDTRRDFRFYVDHSVGYYRLGELLCPQAISQWYLGSGATVGFSTISGLAAIDELITLREKGEFDFEVWPQENLTPAGDKHVLVESYPAICPELDDYGPCLDQHQRDAWKVLQFLINARGDDSLAELFQINEQSVGRVEGVPFAAQVEFEGFIFGLR